MALCLKNLKDGTPILPGKIIIFTLFSPFAVTGLVPPCLDKPKYHVGCGLYQFRITSYIPIKRLSQASQSRRILGGLDLTVQVRDLADHLSILLLASSWQHFSSMETYICVNMNMWISARYMSLCIYILLYIIHTCVYLSMWFYPYNIYIYIYTYIYIYIYIYIYYIYIYIYIYIIYIYT